MSIDDRGLAAVSGTAGGPLDVERDSDVPISTQIYWQLAYQIDSGRLLPGARLPPVRATSIPSWPRTRRVRT